VLLTVVALVMPAMAQPSPDCVAPFSEQRTLDWTNLTPSPTTGSNYGTSVTNGGTVTTTGPSGNVIVGVSAVKTAGGAWAGSVREPSVVTLNGAAALAVGVDFDSSFASEDITVYLRFPINVRNVNFNAYDVDQITFIAPYTDVLTLSAGT